jgi:hypothetical protein
MDSQKVKMAMSVTQQQVNVGSNQHHAVMKGIGCYAFLTGDDFFPTIIVLSPVFHAANIFFLSSDCHRAHT